MQHPANRNPGDPGPAEGDDGPTVPSRPGRERLIADGVPGRHLPDTAYRLIGRFSVTRFDRVLHPLLYRWTGGRGVLGRVFGCETILLTTTGRRSGRQRTVAVFGFPIERGWAVIATRGGSGRIPAWYRNLDADRSVEVQLGTERFPATARDTWGDEYERLFELAATTFPGYRIYRDNARHAVPVVALERREPGVQADGPDSKDAPVPAA